MRVKERQTRRRRARRSLRLQNCSDLRDAFSWDTNCQEEDVIQDLRGAEGQVAFACATAACTLVYRVERA
eukprot:9000956-Prorocentrum_lima.AAC.1